MTRSVTQSDVVVWQVFVFVFITKPQIPADKILFQHAIFILQKTVSTCSVIQDSTSVVSQLIM